MGQSLKNSGLLVISLLFKSVFMLKSLPLNICSCILHSCALLHCQADQIIPVPQLLLLAAACQTHL